MNHRAEENSIWNTETRSFPAGSDLQQAENAVRPEKAYDPADGSLTEETDPVEEMLPLIEWVAEQMPGGFLIYRADPEKNIMYVNTAILRMFGCKSLDEFREYTGFTFRGLIYPEDYDTVSASIEKQIADERNDNLDYVEYRIRRRDGEVRWVNDYGHFVGTPGLGGAHYVFLSDVTEKRAAEEENRRRAEVIEGLSIDFRSIFLIGLHSGVMRPYRMNSGFLSDFFQNGQIEDWRAVLSAYADRYVLRPDQAAFRSKVSGDRIPDALKARESFTIDYRIQSGSGEVRYMQMSVVRIGGETPSPHAVMGFRDVTEQVLRVQRDAASRLRMELELEKEKQAHEAKSEFLFNISHDIRTPMNAIMGFTELARKHLDSPELLRDYLEKVHESNEHMLSLIDNLLEMSQIDSGHIHLKSETCSLREEIEIPLKLLSGQAEDKGIRLTSEIDIPDVEVMVDVHRFRRILTNLIDNAIKFTPNGGSVKVTAKAGEVSESGYARYQFQISDTGVGMGEDFSNRIFKAFEREVSSTRSGVMGTGLGLSIVKSLLDVMGGSVSVKSQKGKGSVFTVSLPIKQAGYGPDVHGETPDTPPVYASKKPGEHRILLVEDIEINRMLAETILEEAGFLVESVPDGTDAVEAIGKHPRWYYDLVLMDIQMPVMNGYEATRAIRAMNREDAKKIPIIALSANARDEDRRMSMESGMDSHIAKPFDMAHLISTINTHIGERERKS